MAVSSPLLSVLFYDDRYNETRDRRSQPLYKALDLLQVPFLVGPPAGSVPVSAGKPGDGPAEKKVPHSMLKYRPGMKIRWLMQQLQTVTSEFVFILDTDVVWLCAADEVVQKRKQLLRQTAGSRDDSVLLFGEMGMWPPYQEFHGTVLRSNATAGYPPATSDAPFRFLNAGASLGRPRDLLAMYRCMEARYVGFPESCPAGHGPDGDLRYYFSNQSWRPPALVTRSARHGSKYHGMLLNGPHWGWEQGCFHQYYLESLAGELPTECPPMILDRKAQWVLHLSHVSRTSLNFNRGDQQSSSPRVAYRPTHERPCVLHSNGPAKKALRAIWRWWETPSRAPPSWR